MNTFKKVIFISVIVFFTITFNNPVKAERDCSNPKGFHEKMMCKYQNKEEDVRWFLFMELLVQDDTAQCCWGEPVSPTSSGHEDARKVAPRCWAQYPDQSCDPR